MAKSVKSKTSKRRTVKIPTTQRIEKLYKAGKIEELRKLNERYAKVANQRMAQFYKSGIKSTSALDRAQYYIWQESGLATGGVFSRSKKLSPDKLLEQMKEILIFLRSPTSTVTGEKIQRAKKSFKALTQGKDGKKPYMPIPDNIKLPKGFKGSASDYFENKFMSFLQQDAWKDIKKYLYASDTSILSDAGEAIARGASISDLKEAYKDFLEGETDIYTMWENWTSIK